MEGTEQSGVQRCQRGEMVIHKPAYRRVIVPILTQVGWGEQAQHGIDAYPTRRIGNMLLIERYSYNVINMLLIERYGYNVIMDTVRLSTLWRR